MLIKHCVQDHCNAAANEGLSVNEEYNMIMDRWGVVWSLVSGSGIRSHTPASSSAF